MTRSTYFYTYKKMVDEITPKSGENGVFLKKNGENGIVLKVFGNFGCKKCKYYLALGVILL